MGRRRKDETPSGLWSASVGEYGRRVRVHERERGGPVHLDWRDDDGKRRGQSLRFSVRTPSGALDTAKAERARERAEEKARRIETAALKREMGEPLTLTVADAFRLYHDPETGGLPPSESARKHHRTTRQVFTRDLGADEPWNAITPNEIDAIAARVARDRGVPTADKCVKCLRTLARWLDRRAGFEGAKDPTRHFDFKRLRAGHEPRRPRYTTAELRKLLAVRYEIDPRFALMLVLAVDSGARSVALYEGTRAMVDPPLDTAPPAGAAPFGYAVLPALKGAPSALTYLTLRQRLELARATWRHWNGARWAPGVLSKLEARYRADEIEDYPLIPGGYLDGDGCARDLSPISGGTANAWLRRAEKVAGVEHVHRRAWHGIRRTWSDGIYQDTDLDTLTDAGGWTDRDVPADIYLSQVRHGRLERAREAQEGRWE